MVDLMRSRLDRLRGWRERVRSLPQREISVRLGWIWLASAVLVWVGVCIPRLSPFATVAAFPAVWIIGDLRFARLVTALTGGRLEESPHTRWVLWIPRVLLILLTVFFAVAGLVVVFGDR